ATADFEPAGVFTHPAALATTLSTLNIHLGRGLGKRKIRRAKTHWHIRLKERFEELIHGAFEIGKTDVFIYHQTFHLMKHRRVSHIRITAINSTRTYHPNRRL